MANTPLTIADLVSDALDLSGNELSEVRAAAPIVAAMPAVEASNGLFHKYSVLSALPTVGFRSEYQGRDFSKSVDRIDSLELKHLDFSWSIDRAVAMAWRDGGAEALVAREGLRHVKAALFSLEQQIINGSSVNADGFLGLADNAYLNQLSDEMVVNAGGSAVGATSSVYFVRVNNAENCMVYKGGGGAVSLGDTIVQNTLDINGKNFPSLYTPAGGWFGMQLGAKFSTARIVNLDDSNGLTDDLIYDALERFPAGGEPNMMIMNKKSQEQLRKSRTATNTIGSPAPMVDGVAGVRIITTDAITHAEAVKS